MKNYEYFSNIFNETEDYMSSAIKDILEMSGVDLFSEIDENFVKTWNSLIGFYGRLKELSLNYAMMLDSQQEDLDRRLNEISRQNAYQTSLIERLLEEKKK